MSSSDATITAIEPPALPEDSVLGLTLLTDVGCILPCDAVFDFLVSGVDLALGQAALTVVIDAGTCLSFTEPKATVYGLAPGWHLLRAALVGPPHGVSFTAPTTYVEAEFYVEDPSIGPAHPRPYLFGAPSLCLLQPVGRPMPGAPTAVPSASAASTAEPIDWTNAGLVIDPIAHNCEISAAAHGFQLRVYANGCLLASTSDLVAFRVVVPPELASRILHSTPINPVPGPAPEGQAWVEVLALLVNPANEEVLMPEWGAQRRSVLVLTASS